MLLGCLSMAFNYSNISLVPPQNNTLEYPHWAPNTKPSNDAFLLYCLFVYCSPGEWTQDVMHGRQMLYYWAIHTLSAPHCAMVLFNMECSISRGRFWMTGKVLGHSMGVCAKLSSLPIFQKEDLWLTLLWATCESHSHPTFLVLDVYYFPISLCGVGILHDLTHHGSNLHLPDS